jgi:hypothetical protein
MRVTFIATRRRDGIFTPASASLPGPDPGVFLVFYSLIIRAKHLGAGGGLYVAGIMWCPALPAFATLKLNGRSLSDVGWKWPGTHSALMSWYIPLLYAAIACAIVWLSGLGGFPNQGQGGLMWSSASIQGIIAESDETVPWENTPHGTLESASDVRESSFPSLLEVRLGEVLDHQN